MATSRAVATTLSPPSRAAAASARPRPVVITAIREIVPEADLELPAGASRPGSALDITRIHDDTGFAPEYDTARATADYIAWLRAGNER